MKNKQERKWNIIMAICLCGIVISVLVIDTNYYRQWKDKHELLTQQEELVAEKAEATHPQKSVVEYPQEVAVERQIVTPIKKPEILEEYKKLYEQNSNLIGWLSIKDTVIDYPVMQTPEDESKYLYLDFYGNENKNGCLVMDTDSVVGNGTLQKNYKNGTAPSTNLIIHGHTMRSGMMFGDLDLYKEEEYGKKHSSICFDSLYEHREYELISAFYSQVYYENEDVFKYYQFFQADTKAEFDDWYKNIKKMSLYDTGVEAEFGDEFITLSCCAYHVENGRFVVVGKRIR